MTEETIKKLIESCEFSPEKIGIEILKSQGYFVEKYRYSGAVFVHEKDKQGKILYYDEGSDEE